MGTARRLGKKTKGPGRDDKNRRRVDFWFFIIKTSTVSHRETRRGWKGSRPRLDGGVGVPIGTAAAAAAGRRVLLLFLGRLRLRLCLRRRPRRSPRGGARCERTATSRPRSSGCWSSRTESGRSSGRMTVWKTMTSSGSGRRRRRRRRRACAPASVPRIPDTCCVASWCLWTAACPWPAVRCAVADSIPSREIGTERRPSFECVLGLVALIAFIGGAVGVWLIVLGARLDPRILLLWPLLRRLLLPSVAPASPPRPRPPPSPRLRPALW